MGQIRFFHESDIPQVVQLRRKSFQFSEQVSDAAQEEYFREIYFQNPWFDPEMPSLVFEESDLRIVGFLGIVPRPMVLCEKPIRAAISTNLMVEPSHRGLVGLSLLKRFLAGSQDLSLADCANESARMAWQAVGGSNSVLHSFFWTRPLRPNRHAAGSFAYARKRTVTRALSRGMVFALRPLLNAADWSASQQRGSPFFQGKPRGSTEELNPGAMVSMLDKFTTARRLRPVYTEESLLWLFRKLDKKVHYGTLQKVLVRNENREPAGWFIYFAHPGGRGQVVQVAASKGQYEYVLQHLWHHAWQRGTIVLEGRIDPECLTEYLGGGCAFRREGPWMLVHARSAELLESIFRGDAFLTRLEGEWWMSF